MDAANRQYPRGPGKSPNTYGWWEYPQSHAIIEDMAKCIGVDAFGDPCSGRTVEGTELCWWCGGRVNQPSHTVRKKIVQAASRLTTTYGAPRRVDAIDAMVEEVARTQGHVDYLEDKIHRTDPDVFARELWEAARMEATQEERDVNFPQAFADIYMKQYAWERKHLVEVCSKVIGGKYTEKQTQFIESQVVTLARVLRKILDSLELTPEQEDLARELLPKKIAEITRAGELTISGEIV